MERPHMTAAEFAAYQESEPPERFEDFAARRPSWTAERIDAAYQRRYGAQLAAMFAAQGAEPMSERDGQGRYATPSASQVASSEDERRVRERLAEEAASRADIARNGLPDAERRRMLSMSPLGQGVLRREDQAAIARGERVRR